VRFAVVVAMMGLAAASTAGGWPAPDLYGRLFEHAPAMTDRYRQAVPAPCAVKVRPLGVRRVVESGGLLSADTASWRRTPGRGRPTAQVLGPLMRPYAAVAAGRAAGAAPPPADPNGPSPRFPQPGTSHLRVSDPPDPARHPLARQEHGAAGGVPTRLPRAEVGAHPGQATLTANASRPVRSPAARLAAGGPRRRAGQPPAPRAPARAA
jgi:hypothetical protein